MLYDPAPPPRAWTPARARHELRRARSYKDMMTRGMAFTGTDRFELLGRLGAGGMGVVYEAYDRVRGMRVALKTLRRVSANRLLRFKREFRALRELGHPNIITLYELIAEGKQWLFTMELLHGQDMVAYIRKRADGTGERRVTLLPEDGADALRPDQAEELDTEDLLAGETRVDGPWFPGVRAASAITDPGTHPGTYPAFDSDTAVTQTLVDAAALWPDASFEVFPGTSPGAPSHAPGNAFANTSGNAFANTSGNAFANTSGSAFANTSGSAFASASPDALSRAAFVRRPGLPPRLDERIDLERLRHVFGQLAAALHALHGAGMIHRDLKPSNVLVTREGRAVLMDFGIVADTRQPRALTATGMVPGTPAFMSPEQVRGAPLTAAVDWYAFGVILYTLLAGRLPFDGGRAQVLFGKQILDAPPPSRFTSGIPPALEHLCMRLLARDPADRPGSREVMDVLGVAGASALRAPTPLPMSRELFVGRGRELALLGQLHGEARAGAMRCALIEAPSGMGKSRLVERFLSRLDAMSEETPVILTGRCHERESLPYKAFDGVMDLLSQYFADLPDEQRRACMPSEIYLLVRLFPVLRRVPECDVTVTFGGDPRRLRVHALRALRSLLTRLARIRPLVIHIDDVQWIDRDSVELLLGLMQPPRPAGLLLLMCARQEAGAGPERAALDELRAAMAQLEICRRIELGPLALDEQQSLVDSLGASLGRRRVDDSVWRDAAGHPLLLAELARYAREDGETTSERPRLEDILWRRVERTSEAERALLDAVAFLGEPAPLRVLADAAALSHAERERALTMLVAGQLVRITRAGHEPWLDTYHARLREAVIARVGSERARRLHRQIARSMETWNEASPALRARHWQAAGEPDLAVECLLAAARSAAAQLAFDRAGELYQQALDLLDEIPQRDPGADPGRALWRCQAWIGLAESLRVADQERDALDLLDRAQELASARGFLAELSDTHYLRGNLLFPRGDLDGCLGEHARARVLARRAGSPLREARASSGLGHAYYMRGQMITAQVHYDHCIALGRDHGFEDVLAANLPMRGLTRFYQNDLHAAAAAGEEAVVLAAGIGHRRAELSALCHCTGLVWIELGRLDRAHQALSRAIELARELGALRFETSSWLFLGKLLVLQGRRAEALPLIERSVAHSRQLGHGYVGPIALGTLALLTDDASVRAHALAEAESILGAGIASHNHLYFYRDAMELALLTGDHARVERYAAALERYTAAEPLPWSDFFIARARLLSAWARGYRDADLLARLQALHRRACEIGFHVASEALAQALASWR
jgi:serine/threonine protein kinase/tetratricopeptide (TPR) repeat protein